MKKRILALLLAAITLLAMAAPAMAATPVIEKTEYEGGGKVEVEFRRDVQYKNVKVTVKDASGKSYGVKIREKDEDDMTFVVSGIKAGTKYTYVISGVRSGRSGGYASVKGSFKTPAKAGIKKVEYDHEDRELEVEFGTKVQYKNLKVAVKDASGKSYSAKVIRKDSDDLELRVKGLKLGKKYTVTVSGVRAKGAGSYGKVSKTFKAIDD